MIHDLKKKELSILVALESSFFLFTGHATFPDAASQSGYL